MNAIVAQLAEQLICNQQVGGSSPLDGSTLGGGETGRRTRLFVGRHTISVPWRFESFPSSLNAGVAQLVELQPSKLIVAGSSPVSRST